jgi:outer membrane lipoprotein-sorting protein
MVSFRAHLARRRQTVKSEIRKPKAEASSKVETRKPKTENQAARLFRLFGFVSDFGFRISDFFLLLGFLLLFFSWNARCVEPDSALDRWLSAQTNLHTWSADLIQTRSLKVLSQPLVSTGRVWVVLPDRFRWELGQPAQTIALRQGTTLSVIYPRLKRVEKYPLDEKQPGPWRDALALLDASFPRSRAELESRFRMVSMTVTNAVWELALEPKSASARRFMNRIVVGLHTNDFLLTSTELRFSDGSIMRNDFTNAVLNQPLDASRFEAKIEPGFTVVEPLRQGAP